MENLVVEIVKNALDLEIDDVIIFANGRGLQTAKICKKVALSDNQFNYYKSTKCLVNISEYERKRFRWDSFMQKSVEQIYTVKTQRFNLEEFNKIKYVKFYENQIILKVKK